MNDETFSMALAHRIALGILIAHSSAEARQQIAIAAAQYEERGMPFAIPDRNLAEVAGELRTLLPPS